MANIGKDHSTAKAHRWPVDRFCDRCGKKLSRYRRGTVRFCYTCESRRAEKMMARANKDIYAAPVELRVPTMGRETILISSSSAGTMRPRGNASTISQRTKRESQP